jgi:hypothetical protein
MVSYPGWGMGRIQPAPQNGSRGGRETVKFYGQP